MSPPGKPCCGRGFTKIPFFLWSESNAQDLRRGHAVVEFLKSEFLRRCSGFVVPGQSARNIFCVHAD